MKTIRWGMIGCGSVAEVKSGPGFYHASNSMLAAVTSRRLDVARDFAARHGVTKVHASAEQLVADPEIDAVYIATPPASHCELTLLAASAGKHVYVEKPMAMRLDECEAMVEACERNGVRLFVAFYRRAMPRFLQIRQWIVDGEIGAPRCVRVLQHQAPEAAELSRATLPWRLLPEVAGGGKFLDMGIHMLDFFDFVFGSIVAAHGIAGNLAGLYDVEDTVTATWRHASGVQGCGSWSYVCGENRDLIEIVGDKGRIEFEFFADSPLRLLRQGESSEVRIVNPQFVQQPFIQSIVDDLLGIAPCPGSVASAVNSTRVADSILHDFRAQHAA